MEIRRPWGGLEAEPWRHHTLDLESCNRKCVARLSMLAVHRLDEARTPDEQYLMPVLRLMQSVNVYSNGMLLLLSSCSWGSKFPVQSFGFVDWRSCQLSAVLHDTDSSMHWSSPYLQLANALGGPHTSGSLTSYGACDCQEIDFTNVDDGVV